MELASGLCFQYLDIVDRSRNWGRKYSVLDSGFWTPDSGLRWTEGPPDVIHTRGIRW